MREIEKCEIVQPFHFLCDVIALVFGLYASSHTTFALSSFLSIHLSNLCVHSGKQSGYCDLLLRIGTWLLRSMVVSLKRAETWPSGSRGTVLIDRNYKSFVVYVVVPRSGSASIDGYVRERARESERLIVEVVLRFNGDGKCRSFL